MGNIIVERKKTKRKYNEDDDEEDDNEPLAKKIKLKGSKSYIHRSLFLEGQASDVTIEAFNQRWKLHKLFLSKIDYFKSMFKTQWSESKQDVIRLQFSDPLISVESFEVVIECLYTDVIKLDTSITPSVLATASWFAMEELINFTVRYLEDNLSYDTVPTCLELANKYNLNQLLDDCVEFLARNILIHTTVDILKSISCDVMRRIITNDNLCVINLEDSVYDLLKTWWHLKVDCEFEGSLSELVKASDAYVGKNLKGKPEFYMDCYGDERKLFLEIRLKNAILINDFCIRATEDNIIPRDGLLRAYQDQWRSLISAFSPSNERKPPASFPDVDNDVFEKLSIRCGRTLGVNGNHYWKWKLFDFGFELFFSWVNNNLSIIHKNKYGFFRPSATQVLLRYEIFSLNSKGGVEYSYKSDKINLPICLSQGRACFQVEDLPKNKTLYFSCRILRVLNELSSQICIDSKSCSEPILAQNSVDSTHSGASNTHSTPTIPSQQPSTSTQHNTPSCSRDLCRVGDSNSGIREESISRSVSLSSNESNSDFDDS